MKNTWYAVMAMGVLLFAAPAGAETSMRVWTSIEHATEGNNLDVAQREKTWSDTDGLAVSDVHGGKVTQTTDPGANLTRLDAPLDTNGPNTAAAYVDLATGKMGASASATGLGNSNRYAPGNGYAEGIASFSEGLTFTTTDPDASTPSIINYEITVHNLLSGTGGWDVNGDLRSSPTAASSFWITSSTIFDKTSDVTYSYLSPDMSVIRGTASFIGSKWEPTLYLRLMASARADGPGEFSAGSANLMNTATVRFELPKNVTMTSASGKFLSAASNSAVPEPGTWLTMLLGFGVIGVALRRRTVLRFV